MTIAGFGSFQITSPNVGPFLIDTTLLFGPGTGYGGFGFQFTADSMHGIAALGTMPSFSGSVTVNGPLQISLGVTFTTTAGDLVFLNTSGTATFNGEFPSSAVPEPTSMAIFGLGALGMAAYRAKRKTKT